MAFTLSNWFSPLSLLSGLLRPARRAAPCSTPDAAEQPAPPTSVAAVLPQDNPAHPQIYVTWTQPAPPASPLPAVHWEMPADAVYAATAARTTASSQTRAARRKPPLPLKVVRRELGEDACRLVISGRMADVCAELDRLVLH